MNYKIIFIRNEDSISPIYMDANVFNFKDMDGVIYAFDDMDEGLVAYEQFVRDCNARKDNNFIDWESVQP
jgi:hypothetical protein